MRPRLGWASARGAQAAEYTLLAQPDVDQHGDDQDDADETLTQCCGMTKEVPSATKICSDSSAAQQVITAAPASAPSDRAVAAEDAAAADDHRGDDVELAQRAGRRIERAVEGDIDEAGERGAGGASKKLGNRTRSVSMPA